MCGAIGGSEHIHGLFATLDLVDKASIIYIYLVLSAVKSSLVGVY